MCSAPLVFMNFIFRLRVKRMKILVVSLWIHYDDTTCVFSDEAKGFVYKARHKISLERAVFEKRLKHASVRRIYAK